MTPDRQWLYRTLVGVLICLTLTATALSQDPKSGRFGERAGEIDRLNMRLRLPSDDANRRPQNISPIIEALLTERPKLIETVFAENIPDFNRPIKIVEGRGRREENPRGNTVVMTIAPGTRVKSLEGDIQHFGLNVLTPVIIPALETTRRKLEHAIEERVAKELPEFSRERQRTQLQMQTAAAQKELERATLEAAQADAWVHREDPMPIEKTAEQLAETSRQLISTQLALAGMKAREQAIREAILATSAKMDQSSDDRTLKSLEQLRKLRAERLERLKQLTASGAASQDDVQKAEADVLAAEIDADKTRSAVKRAAGGERLEALNNELSRLAIDRAESEARLDFLRKMMDETSAQLRDRRDIQQHVDEAKPKLAELREKIRSLNDRLAELKDAAEHTEPLRVELPDSDAAEAR